MVSPISIEFLITRCTLEPRPVNVRSFQPDFRFFALSSDTFIVSQLSILLLIFTTFNLIGNCESVVSTKRRTKCNALLKTPIETAKTSSDVQRGTLKCKILVDRLLGVKRFATRR